MIKPLSATLFPLLLSLLVSCSGESPSLNYMVSMEDPSDHLFHIGLECYGFNDDTVTLNMPAWMPGYYQIMNYAEKVENVNASVNGHEVSVIRKDSDSWQVISGGKPFRFSYEVKADRRFVANNYLDSTHAYVVNAATFMYVENGINLPVNVTVIPSEEAHKIVTGLNALPGEKNRFYAASFDILYDCPILTGDLEELPPFEVNGIRHRFIGWNIGDFDRDKFIQSLKKIIEQAVNMIGEIPYDEYTFIGIGPGYGGIEHLNNTTVSFDGSRIRDEKAMTGMLKFLAHEYFHHYNVKRIRPFELGPFDYSHENRTNLLWVSEGLTVYYEYILMKRAGLLTDEEFYSCLESNINAYENDPGKEYQSLVQASYNTWSDGPFGSRDPANDRSISCYDKGAVAGLIIDLAIRHATDHTRSLDYVMRKLYQKYYRELGRGFTEAEFQEACEIIAGRSLADEFEYVRTTKEIDYDRYLGYVGLNIAAELTKEGKRIYTITAAEKEAAGAKQIERW